MAKPSSETSLPVNQEGKVEDIDLAQEMANKMNETRNIMEYGAANESDKEDIAQMAETEGEGVFREKTGQDFSAAVAEAQETLQTKTEQVDQAVQSDIKTETKRVEQHQGATPQDVSTAKQEAVKLRGTVNKAADRAKGKLEKYAPWKEHGRRNKKSKSWGQGGLSGGKLDEKEEVMSQQNDVVQEETEAMEAQAQWNKVLEEKSDEKNAEEIVIAAMGKDKEGKNAFEREEVLTAREVFTRTQEGVGQSLLEAQEFKQVLKDSKNPQNAEKIEAQWRGLPEKFRNKETKPNMGKMWTFAAGRENALRNLWDATEKSNSQSEFDERVAHLFSELKESLHESDQKLTQMKKAGKDKGEEWKKEIELKRKRQIMQEVYRPYLPKKSEIVEPPPAASGREVKPEGSGEAGITKQEKTSSFRNPTELDADIADKRFRTNGKSYANGEVPDDAYDAALDQKNGKSKKKKEQEKDQKEMGKAESPQKLEASVSAPSFEQLLMAFDTALDDLVNRRKQSKDKHEKQRLTLDIRRIAKEKDDFIDERKKSEVVNKEHVIEAVNEQHSPTEEPRGPHAWAGLSREEFLKEKMKEFEENEASAQQADQVTHAEEKQEQPKAEEASKEKEAAAPTAKSEEPKKDEKKSEEKGVTSAETAKTKAEFTSEQTHRIETELKEFSLTPEDAETIEGFKGLSYGQRRMALENLKQLTLKDIRVGAVKDQREETLEAKGFWKKVWTGIKKRYSITKAEKTRSRSISKEEYLQTLEQLSRGMKNFGVGVEEKNGQLEMQYASGFEGLTPEQQAQVDRYNQVATELSRMPMEWTAPSAEKKGIFRQIREGLGLGQGWSPDDPKRKDHQRTQGLEGELQSLRGNMLGLLEKQYRKEELKNPSEYSDIEAQSNATAHMMRMENLMRTNRLLNTNPEVESALKDIKDGSVWKKAIGNIATERGIYFAAGFAARSAGVALLGSAGLIAGAAGVGGWMGWRRGKEAFRENEALAKHKSFEQMKQERTRRLARIGKEGKEAVQKSEKKTMLKTEDASVLAKNLDHFIEYINREEDPSRRHDLARRLADRVGYVQRVMNEGRINLGENATVRANSLYELTDKLNLAINCAEMNNPTTRHKEKGVSDIQQRMEHYLGEQKGLVDSNKRKELWKKAGMGALWAAGFTTAGMAAREVFQHADPHLFNKEGEVDVGVRWVSDTKGGGNVTVPPEGVGPRGSGGEHPPMGMAEGTHAGGIEGTGLSPKFIEQMAQQFPEAKNPQVQQVLKELGAAYAKHPDWKTNLIVQRDLLVDAANRLEAQGISSGKAAEIIREVNLEASRGDIIPVAHPAEEGALSPTEGTMPIPGKESVAAAAMEQKAAAGEGLGLSPHTLVVGKRGPEGALIDHLRTNPDIAKSFGWDGKTNLSEWAGTKAHTLWLENAKEALAKPETIAELKKLGYSADAKGYADMMHRIGKGFVELDPKTHEINLVDMDYLRAKTIPDVVESQSPAPASVSSDLHITPKGYMVDTPQDVMAHQATVAANKNPLNKYMVDTPQDVEAHQTQTSEDAIAKIINDYESSSAKRPPENILAQNEATNVASDAAEHSNASSEAAPIPHSESFDKISHDDLHIEYRFGYDHNGNPTGLTIERNEPFGVRGSEYFTKDYPKAIVGKLQEIHRPTLEHVYRDEASRDGRELIGLIKFYQELEYQGETKEAEFLHKHILDEMSQMMKKYGPIIDRDKLPEAFRGK